MCHRSDLHWWKCNDADASAVTKQDVNMDANMGGAMFFFNKLCCDDMEVESDAVVNERKRRPDSVRRTKKRRKQEQRKARRFQTLESRGKTSGDD